MIPTASLRDTVSITPPAGTSGTGVPVYGTPVAGVPTSMVTDAKTIRDMFGRDVTAGAASIVRPTVAVAVGSLITHSTGRYEVLEIRRVSELRRPHHIELLLDGPRPAA